MTQNKIDPCPYCDFELDDGDIYEHCLEKSTGDKEKALELAKHFGWSEEDPKRFTLRCGTYNPDLDRTDKLFCPSCHRRLPDKDDKSIQP